ncbi:unnamed protein product [Urochloa humidicola]
MVQSGVGSIRHRVVLPQGILGRMAENELNAEQFDEEDVYTDLISRSSESEEGKSKGMDRYVGAVLQHSYA